MTEPMDLARFEMLIAAYGATASRWPEQERAAAEAFAHSDPRAAALLAKAGEIDALLFTHRVAEPSRALRAMVIESAPRRRQLSERARLWWVGFAAALAAGGGALAGSAATTALVPTAAHLQIYEHDDVVAYDDANEESAS